MRDTGPKTSPVTNLSLQNLSVVPRDSTKVKPSKRNRVVLELRFANARGYSRAALLTTRPLYPGIRTLSSSERRLWEPWLGGTACFTPHILPRVTDRLGCPCRRLCSRPWGLTFSSPRVLLIEGIHLNRSIYVAIRRLTATPGRGRPITS